jgi:2-polyprenyl-3-methyl-5-hydroxy-6-metoxy-1,4-benzoquinol methylase
MKLDTTKRSTQPEIMDDFEMKGDELKRTLRDLDKVNAWLGGNKITLQGVEYLLEHSNFQAPLKIIDVGCGNGSLLKEVAELGRKRGLKMELLGVDANTNAMEIARENTASFPEINFAALDVFSEEFNTQKADIILCTLTLHHFTDHQIELLMRKFVDMVNLGVVVNDLQRSKTAYYLFKAFCAVFISNEVNKLDGLTSILRSFKKEDLEKYGQGLEVKEQIIRWRWAFRYQWIIKK